MKILFATDGATQSTAAIEMLKRFALADDDEIRIINILDMAVPVSIDLVGGYVPDTSGFEERALEHASRILSETEEKFRTFFSHTNVTITTDVLFGSPGSRIVEAAREFAADLVVIGSHGHNRLERLLLGSVSDSVVHHAPCSVLVVRTPTE